MDGTGEQRTGRGVTSGAVRAEFFKLIQHYGERGWIAVERFSDPLRARLVYRAEHNRRRSGPFANEGDERLITVTETGSLRVESGGLDHRDE
ncbi:MAG: hypothetical protein WD628_04390 [Thermomicrobiales bacterium]